MQNTNDFSRYATEVVSYIMCSEKKARLIRSDIVNHLREKSSNTGEYDPVKLMGEPYEVAQEFIENLEENVRTPQMEYTSKIYINGIPLIHLNRRPNGVAKGIIAIGTVAIGLFSIGIVSVGVFSLGVLSLGLLIACGAVSAGGIAAFGGLAASILYAFGGMAISNYFSAGGLAISNNIAFGGYAVGREIAVGGVAHGNISIFRQNGVGNYLFNMNKLSAESIIESVKNIKPNISDFVLELIKITVY